MTQDTTVGFDTIINGEEAYIEFTRRTTFGRDLYGSDADGRRGMWVDSIDDDQALDILVMLYDDSNLTQSVINLQPEMQTIVKALVDEYLDTHEAEMEEQPEPEYDDIDD